MSVYARYARYLLPAKQMVQMCKVIEEMKSDEFFKFKRSESDVGIQDLDVFELPLGVPYNRTVVKVGSKTSSPDKPNLDEHPRRTLRVVGGTITTCTVKEARRFMQDG